MITATEIITEIKLALKQFGTYTYRDKGAGEIMDINSIVKRLKEMTSLEIVHVLTEVRREPNLNAEPFLTDCCGQFDTWDDPRCDELFESDLFQECY